MMNLFQRSLFITCCVMLLNVNSAYGQISINDMKTAVQKELSAIFKHNSGTSQYEIYSIKIDDVQEQDKTYTVTGSFKFKNNSGNISSNIRFDAKARKVLNEITVPTIMVNFDDIVNSWQSATTTNNSEDDNPLSMDKMHAKLVERCLTLSYVKSVESLSINISYSGSTYKKVNGTVKYKKEDGTYGTFWFEAIISAEGKDCYVERFSK